MLNPFVRIGQRYLVPRWLASTYFYFRDGALVSRHARVQLTRHISFGRGTVVKPFVVIQTHTGRISFGRGCAVSSFDHLSTGDGPIRIGDSVRIAPNVTIVGGTKEVHDRTTRIEEQGVAAEQGVEIGDDVLIGAGSVILPGCRIGKGAVVGAGSVVKGEVAEYAIVAGAPARQIGQRG